MLASPLAHLGCWSSVGSWLLLTGDKATCTRAWLSGLMFLKGDHGDGSGLAAQAAEVPAPPVLDLSRDSQGMSERAVGILQRRC